MPTTNTPSSQPLLDDDIYDRAPREEASSLAEFFQNLGSATPQSSPGIPATAHPSSAPTRNYVSLKMEMGLPELAKGLVFDANLAASALQQACRETTGYCQRSVANALAAAGFNARAGLTQQGGGHNAKDMAPLLRSDPRFRQVGGGVGGEMDSPWEYKAQKGDIAVWEGGPYGHIQMCVGQRADGSPIWQSDFTAREGNWTGLRDPNSHGHFAIFRQQALEPKLEVAATKALQKKVGPKVATDDALNPFSMKPKGFRG